MPINKIKNVPSAISKFSGTLMIVFHSILKKKAKHLFKDSIEIFVTEDHFDLYVMPVRGPGPRDRKPTPGSYLITYWSEKVVKKGVLPHV